VAALSSTALVIDADALATDLEHREAVEASLATASGLPLSLRPRPAWAEADAASAAEARDASQAASAALDFVSAYRHWLAPDRARTLRAKLAACAIGDAPIRAAFGATRPTTRATATAAAYVALTRMLHPLRRAHFHVDQWQRK
jgi:hypothetical protein